MNYEVRVLRRAREDFESILAWINERSPEAAARFAARFQESIGRLALNPYTAALAPESRRVGEQIRHAMFRVRAGRTYRILFVVSGGEVRVLRVRSPGLPPANRADLEPDG